MSVFNLASVNRELSKDTSIFGLRLWEVIAVVAGAVLMLFLLILSLCCIAAARRRRYKIRRPEKTLVLSDFTPVVSKEIPEIVHAAAIEHCPAVPEAVPDVQIDIGKIEYRVMESDRGASGGESRANSVVDRLDTGSLGGGRGSLPEDIHLGWGRRYSLRELKDATNGLADQNVIGEGGHSLMYYGVLHDHTKVAIKTLVNTKGQIEEEFKVEVEAIGRVRHKNLVRLLGYCVQGNYWMLVYEYIDNGNLDQWLHGELGDVSPLTWDIRMKIIIGTAKGLAYLHEGLEPKVVHRDIKSSNILLDREWNPKLSDFGLAKLLNSENTYVSTRVMGTFGYVAPEYASTGMLTEKSDIYSFGVLLMEVITGRSPVDHTRPQGEIHLVDWLKSMVGDRKSDEVVDPKLPEQPPSKVLKRIILVALRCVDPDAQKRPKIGHVINMLESEHSLYQEWRIAQESARFAQPIDQSGSRWSHTGTSGTSEDNSSRHHNLPPRW